MKLEYYKDPLTLRSIIHLEFEWEELAEGYNSMDSLWRNLLEDYFEESSPVSAKLFALSEVVKQIEANNERS